MLENVKIGDRVKSCLAGWGTVVKTQKNLTFVDFDAGTSSNFYKNGKVKQDHLYPEIVEVKRKQWEPEGGHYVIQGNGLISCFTCKDLIPEKEGRAYSTAYLAEKAYKLIRPYQRLVAYVLDHAPDWEPNWKNSQTAYIYYSHYHKEWAYELTYNYQKMSVPMSSEVAAELTDKLNSGEVELICK